MSPKDTRRNDNYLNPYSFTMNVVGEGQRIKIKIELIVLSFRKLLQRMIESAIDRFIGLSPFELHHHSVLLVKVCRVWSAVGSTLTLLSSR
jgi:hypothetical protein